PTSSTIYTVQGSNPDGCSGSTTVAVGVYTVPTLTILAFPDEGCSPLDVTFSYAPAGLIDTNSLHWNFGDLASIDNNSDLINPEHIFNYEGSYTVYLSAATNDGCPVAATDTVRAYHKPIADFYFNPEAGYMDDPEIGFVDISVGANSWNWNFGNPASNNLNYSVLQNPYHTYTDTGTYMVELIVSSSHNCSDTVEKPVTIYPSLVIYIPNAFTPNNDILNDIWKPVISGIDNENYHLYIYDRWGKVMFATEDVNEGWNGKYDEKECPEAVYVYMIEYQTKPGKEHKVIRGGVTLIK
ncbi:MAG TPA: gliding motility-associated C-terminal domain-containing protein, partial [Bacteroidales bacterium]|nr:gliding motility-associated C-terminal domain-containing protein [Bacteroidales bacterium]